MIRYDTIWSITEVRFQAEEQIFSTVFRHVVGPNICYTQWVFWTPSPEVTQLEREAGGSRPSSGANVKNVWNKTSIILIGLHGMVRYTKMILLSLPYTLYCGITPGQISQGRHWTSWRSYKSSSYWKYCHLYAGFPVHQETR